VIGWRFALSKRWFGYLGLAIIFAIICVLLGFWQLSRRAETLAEIDLVQKNFDSKPEPIDQVLPSLKSFSTNQKWTPVKLHGTYLDDDQLLVRNRPLNGNPGFEVLVPLLLDDGSVFVVDRGWLPAGTTQDIPDIIPAAPTGALIVVARLKPGEPTLDNHSAPAGQIATIHLTDIAKLVDKPTYTGAYGLLASETPPAVQRPIAVTKPVPDEGPHLSYAVQWFAFALLGFVALGYLLRQEYRQLNSDDPEERARATLRAARAALRRTDSDIEDELVDASGN
jgi:cytochrome oxidase assembly protein ShyY1